MTLFAAGPYRAFELARADVPAVQGLFEANPSFHALVAGRPPAPGDALEEFELKPPFPYGRKWFLGFERADDRVLVGVADVIADIFAPGVWTVGLFFLADAVHGTGAAPRLLAALEGWMRLQGAQWSRLGVAVGNARAERFWEREGYRDVRRREGVVIGERVNALRVMAKPLAGGTLAHYLELVARDRPGSP